MTNHGSPFNVSLWILLHSSIRRSAALAPGHTCISKLAGVPPVQGILQQSSYMHSLV